VRVNVVNVAEGPAQGPWREERGGMMRREVTFRTCGNIKNVTVMRD